jgi:hypothetical protein
MRGALLLLLVSVAVAGLLLRNAKRPSPEPPAQTRSLLVSEHDWAKQALDRTADVKRQVLKQRQEDALP